MIVKQENIYGFQKFKTMESLGVDILNGTVTLDDAVSDQVNLKYAINKFKNSQNQEFRNKRIKKNLLLKIRKSL